MAAVKFPSMLTGIHAVGCVDLMHQNLLVRLFYPTHVTRKQEYTQWLPSTVYANGLIDMVNTLLPSMPWPKNPIDKLISPLIKATYKAPLKHDAQYPVIILSHGLGGNRCMYSGTSIGIASHGYVVANVEHRDESASTSLRRVPGAGAKAGEYEKYVNDWIPFNKNCGIGRFEKNVALRRKQVKIRRKDVSDALDLLCNLNNGEEPVDNMTVENYNYSQFVNQLNTKLCCVIGHSFGGGTVIQTLHDDNRFRCGIALDSNMIPVHEEVYKNGIDQPVLFINSELGYQWKENISQILKFAKPKNSKGITKTPIVTLRGTTHFGFSDFPHAVPGYGGQPLDIEVSHKLVVELSHLFLKRFLCKVSNSSIMADLDGGEGMSDNIILGTVIKDFN